MPSATLTQNLLEKGMLKADVMTAVRSIPAAAADLRMSGGNGSVMTFCGSGNQGISTTLPMAVFADKMNIPEEKLLRAEFMGMLMIMYMKNMLSSEPRLRRNVGRDRLCGRHGLHDGRHGCTGKRRSTEYDGLCCRHLLRWRKGRLLNEGCSLRE